MASNPQLNSEKGRASPSPGSIREETEQPHAERPTEIAMVMSEKGGPEPDHEKPMNSDNNIQERDSGIHASQNSPRHSDSAAIPTSPDAFGADDDEHLTGFKLFAALFAIVSVFFLVLLDFSIISTVSED
jgi:hypothetical protein